MNTTIINDKEALNIFIRNIAQQAKDINTLNHPDLRQYLIEELNIPKKLAGTIIGKAVDVKSQWIKAHKRQSKRHAKLNILESLGKQKLGDATAPDVAKAEGLKSLTARSERDLTMRKTLREQIKAGNARTKDLAKLDAYHGTHYDMIGSDNPITARGKQKDRGTSQAPKGVEFK